MLNISQKKELVDRLSVRLAKAQISILVNYKGLNVAKMTDLRARLRNAGVEVEVVKNTLLKRAAANTGTAVLEDYFKGPTAIITSASDPVAPAKILVDFAKENEKLEIKAGSLSGKLLNTDDIRQLAKMPSREEMLAKLLCTMNAIPASVVTVLAAIPRSFVNVLNAIKEQKEAA